MKSYEYARIHCDPWLEHATFPDPVCSKGVKQSEHLGVDAFEPCEGGCNMGFAEESNGCCDCCGRELTDPNCPQEADPNGECRWCSMFMCPTRQSYCWKHCNCGVDHEGQFADDGPDCLEAHKGEVEHKLVETEG